jgi:ZIP family zinc transporter
MDVVFNLQLYFGIFFASFMTLFGVWLYEGLNHRFPKWVDLLQGLSAGMLLAVIFFGIMPEATEMLEKGFGQCQILITAVSMAAGALLLPGFEKILPVKHHHDFEDSHQHKPPSVIYIVLGAFGIHSLFELLAILVAGSSNPVLGWTLVLIIAIHNIPIGFIINTQLKAFGLPVKRVSLMVFGLIMVQCLMAVIIYVVMLPFVTQSLTGILLGMTSGMMLYLTFDELLPQIYKDEHQHAVNASIIAGLLGMYFILAVGGH